MPYQKGGLQGIFFNYFRTDLELLTVPLNLQTGSPAALPQLTVLMRLMRAVTGFQGLSHRKGQSKNESKDQVFGRRFEASNPFLWKVQNYPDDTF